MVYINCIISYYTMIYIYICDMCIGFIFIYMYIYISYHIIYHISYFIFHIIYIYIHNYIIILYIL